MINYIQFYSCTRQWFCVPIEKIKEQGQDEQRTKKEKMVREVTSVVTSEFSSTAAGVQFVRVQLYSCIHDCVSDTSRFVCDE